jgi:hypothetical protein
MGRVGGAEDRLGLARAIDLVYFRELQDRESAAIATDERDFLARLKHMRLGLGDSKGYRDRPRHTGDQAHRVA